MAGAVDARWTDDGDVEVGGLGRSGEDDGVDVAMRGVGWDGEEGGDVGEIVPDFGTGLAEGVAVGVGVEEDAGAGGVD